MATAIAHVGDYTNMTYKTVRVIWRNRTTAWLNFNWNGVITPDSIVRISVSECTVPNANDPTQCVRFRGAAPIYVKNIRTHGPNPGDTITGGVEFYLMVDWKDSKGNWAPLNVMTDITVFNPTDVTYTYVVPPPPIVK